MIFDLMEHHIAKGVFDILPQDPDPQNQWRLSHLWQYIEDKARALCHEYGFREIRTPLFEHTDLFKRGIGTGTDIVSKEMYTFEDRAGRSLSLRPEGTAPVMRAFLEKRLDQISPVHKLFYLCPLFRYERQQAGRYRQHHQFGVEVVGNDSPLQDVEVIDLLFSFLQDLGLQKITLHINSIGNCETRQNYREALKAFLLPHLKVLSSDSQERFESNPLRILDSKNETDKEIVANAPSILDFLDRKSQEHFESVCKHLDFLRISYKIEPKLVRGLDYYNKTVFEITADEIGSQNSLGGGGRYDGLLQELGGPNLPAFGFGAGLERILQAMLAQKVLLPTPPAASLFLIPIGENAVEKCFELVHLLRKKHIAAEMDFTGKKLKAAMRYADQIKVHFIAVIGDDELATNKLKIKEMQSGDEISLSFEDLLETRLFIKSQTI